MVWAVISKMDVVIYLNKEKECKRHYLVVSIIDQIAILPYLIGAITVLYAGESGVYRIVLAIIGSFIKSVLDAWVLLIEINR